MNFESLPPLNIETPNAEAERVVARTMYEYAVILAVRENDQYAFQRYVSSLRPYYSGYGFVLWLQYNIFADFFMV